MSEAFDMTGMILDALKQARGDGIWATELAFSGGARRCDFWTISANGSAGFMAVAYEIKISRADFRRDSHAKQRDARLFSDRFFYVTPPGLISGAELPDWAGLIEFEDNQLKVRVQAPFRDKSSPTWELLVSLIRNSGEIRRDTDQVRKERLQFKNQLERVEKELRAAGLEPWRFGLT